MPNPAMKVFSAIRSWAICRARAPGASGTRASKKRGGFARHILEFVGDHIDGGGKGFEGREIVVAADGMAGGDLEGRAVGSGA